MAVAWVQGGGSATTSFTFASSTPVGNLIVTVFTYSGAFTSVTDDISQVYTQIGAEIVGASWKMRAYYVKNGTAGVRTITVTAVGFDTLFGEELSGQDPTTPIDAQLGSIHNAATADFTDSITLASANDVVIAVGQANGGTTTITTAGYTTDSSTNFNVLAHKTIVSSGSTSVTFHNDTFPAAQDMLTWLVGVQAPATAGTYLLYARAP